MDLKCASREEVMAITLDIDQVGLFGFEIPRDAYVMRIRAHGCAEYPHHWKSERDIGYIRDSSIVAPMNRANFENDPVFYGTTGLGEQFKYAWLVALAEVSSLVNDNSYEFDEEYVVGGHWLVLHPMHLIALVHHKQFTTKNERLGYLHAQYDSAARKNKELAERSLAFTTFMAEEFAKPVLLGEEYQYKISAAFSTRMRDLGFDGILYPSVKAQGDTIVFNIALTPYAVNTKMKLVQASALRVIRTGNGGFTPLPFLRDTDVVGNFQWKEYSEHYTSAQVQGAIAAGAVLREGKMT